MMSSKTNARAGFQASRGEHRMYASYFFGENFLWAFAGMLATYITDIGIGAAVVATILLVPKIWDAVNDTIFGILLDKVKLKTGEKFLPWMRIGTIGLGFTTLLLFAVPSSLSVGFKIAWVIVAYILFDTSYTMLDAPLFALPSAMTGNIQERTQILSNGRLFAMVGGMGAGLTIPILRPQIGWFFTALLVVGITMLAMLPLMLKGKERQTIADKNEPSISFKEMGIYLKTNHQLMVILLMMFIIGVTGVEAVLSIYISRICFGNESMGSLLVMISVLPVLLVAGFVPQLTKKFDKFHLFIFAISCSVLGGILMFFAGFKSFPVVIALSMLKSIGMAAYNVIAYMFIADTVEYGTYKTGTRASGISFTLQTFTAKLRGALVTSFGLFAIGMIGFVSGEGAVQPAGVAERMWGIYTLLPAVGYVLAIVVLLLFYKLRDKTVQTMSQYNMGEISKAEAEAVLFAKFGAAAEVRSASTSESI